MTDSFYTPKILADKLISYIDHSRTFKNVVDFCVGDGELLRAAEERWPTIQCFGSDISDKAIEYTKSRHSNWTLSRCDFLEPKSRDDSKFLKRKKRFDLILLNPPFTCRAGTLSYTTVEGQQFSTSTSMKFLLEALKYLSPKGLVYAILPLSVAHSQKDRKVWSFLEKVYNLTVLEETSTKYFKNCTPNIILVSLNDFNQSKRIHYRDRSDSCFSGLEVFRGKFSIHMLRNYPGKHYLVHTTNLKHNKIQNTIFKVDYPSSIIQGPALLLPRVGKPDFSKVCIIKLEEEYCISDCIIALKCESNEIALTLFAFFSNNWESFSLLYRGTGAHYITKEKVEQYLNLDLSIRQLDILSSTLT